MSEISKREQVKPDAIELAKGPDGVFDKPVTLEAGESITIKQTFTELGEPGPVSVWAELGDDPKAEKP